MFPIDDSTPIAMLTLGQLKEVLRGIMPQPTAPADCQPQEEEAVEHFNAEDYIFGLDGIRHFFGVSHTTAQRYKDGVLAPAVTQYGRKIMVNKRLAVELMNEYKAQQAL